MTKILIIGGGTAGITVAAQLIRKLKKAHIELFEPSKYHYYQPLYTLVGAGTDKKEKTIKETSKLIPKGVIWNQQKILGFKPKENIVIGEDCKEYVYDYLIVAPGIQLNWHLVKGLTETMGKNGVCSVYGYQESEETFSTLKAFKGGNALFTSPNTPVKCDGAPQKIMYLTEAYLRKKGLRNTTNVIFASGGSKLFSVPGFTEALQKIIDNRKIKTHFSHNLIKVDGPKKEATFTVKMFEGDQQVGMEEKVISFDLLHVAPPQSAPTIITESELAIPDGKLKGWLNVDHYTLQHNSFPNVFGLGDVCGLPTGKTGAAIRKQVPVVVNNVRRLLEKKEVNGKFKYNGYSACPILTDYKHVLMAEFEYGYKPKSSFFFDTTKPRWSMYLLKHFYLPWYYWNRMLKGRN